jgi:hypothetical protein
MQQADGRSDLKVLILFYMFLPIGLLLVLIIPFMPYPLGLFSLFIGFAFLCIGIHELSHLVVAKIKGYRIIKPTAKWYALGFVIQPRPKKEDAAVIYLSSLTTCFIIPPVVFILFGPFWGIPWFLGTFFMSYLDIKSWRECLGK